MTIAAFYASCLIIVGFGLLVGVSLGIWKKYVVDSFKPIKKF